MLKPETVKTLLENAEVKELILHLNEEVQKMDSVTDISEAPQSPQVLAVEVRARQVAIKKIKSILDPLLNPGTDIVPAIGGKEYVT